jgi:hypothetical protein
MPSRNQARFLPRALESILDQSHRPLEVVVRDRTSGVDCASHEFLIFEGLFQRQRPLSRRSATAVRRSESAATEPGDIVSGLKEFFGRIHFRTKTARSKRVPRSATGKAGHGIKGRAGFSREISGAESSAEGKWGAGSIFFHFCIPGFLKLPWGKFA